MIQRNKETEQPHYSFGRKNSTQSQDTNTASRFQFQVPRSSFSTIPTNQHKHRYSPLKPPTLTYPAPLSTSCLSSSPSEPCVNKSSNTTTAAGSHPANSSSAFSATAASRSRSAPARISTTASLVAAVCACARATSPRSWTLEQRRSSRRLGSAPTS